MVTAASGGWPSRRSSPPLSLAVLDARSTRARARRRHAGPHHEPIDPVRFIGNHSSGKMGIAVAAEAAARGATVTLVLRPATILHLPRWQVVRVRQRSEMRSAVDRFAAAPTSS